MITTKIKNYDAIFQPTDPLSDDSQIIDTFIERSGQKIILGVSTSTGYVYNEPVFVAPLYSNEMDKITEVIKSTIAEGATIDFQEDTGDVVRTSYIITATSESGLSNTRRRIIPVDLGSINTSLSVYRVEDVNNTQTNPHYYAESLQSNNGISLKVGTIEVYDFDNTTDYFNVNVITNDSIATNSYVSKGGVEPQGLNTHSVTLVPFDTSEDEVLDDNFVYLKKTNGADTIYFKLVELGVEPTITELDQLKSTMSNKWYHVFNENIAVEVGDMTGAQILNAEPRDDSSLMGYLGSLGIQYHQINLYLSELRDVTPTENEQVSGELIAWNESNVDEFLESDLNDLGASIASDLYDIYNALDETTKLSFEHTIKWFEYIKTRDEGVIVSPDLDNDVKLRVLSKAKNQYLQEFSSASQMWKWVNKRYLEYFLRKLRYVSTLSSQGLIQLNQTTADINIMILALENIKLEGVNTASFDQYTESAFDKFANGLEYLNLKPQVIQRIQWINS